MKKREPNLEHMYRLNGFGSNFEIKIVSKSNGVKFILINQLVNFVILMKLNYEISII